MAEERRNSQRSSGSSTGSSLDSKNSKMAQRREAHIPSSTMDAAGHQIKDSSLIGKLCACAQLLRPRKPEKFKLVAELPHLPTVALDLDGTLVHTLVDPIKIAVAQASGLTTFRLPGNMGLVAQRPGLEQFVSSLNGYNVVLYSAGGSIYVNIVVERLLKSNPIFQGVFCKVLTRPDLTRYSEFAEVPSETPLSTEGICYVKDLRKARADGNIQRVLIVDDNPYAFEVQPHMKDDNFRKNHDFTRHAVPVPDFQATSPDAVLDKACFQVAQILQDVAGAEDLPAALQSHPTQAVLKGEWMRHPFERSPTSPGFVSECALPEHEGGALPEPEAGSLPALPEVMLQEREMVAKQEEFSV